ncbi:MAG: glucosaminidase domain-containing protein [Alicyclobacillus sp.]|nr:glucosaminidase domain-containing protein [Alicyclobacillus sp.]
MPSLATDQAFIESVAPAAVEFYKSHKFSAAVNIAQGCLESLYGTACPTAHGVNSHNLYGIKADTSWRGPFVVVPTQEYIGGRYVTIQAAFRAYPSYADSVTDHNNFFIDNPRYHNLFGMSYQQAANTIAAVDGYATDPNYGAKLLSIIKMFGLQKYDQLPPTHWAVTVGYFNSEKQVQTAAARLLTVCKYHSLGIKQVGKNAKGMPRWVVQVGYFDSEKQAQEAETIIQRKLNYHSISVQAIV